MTTGQHCMSCRPIKHVSYATGNLHWYTTRVCLCDVLAIGGQSRQSLIAWWCRRCRSLKTRWCRRRSPVTAWWRCIRQHRLCHRRCSVPLGHLSASVSCNFSCDILHWITHTITITVYTWLEASQGSSLTKPYRFRTYVNPYDSVDQYPNENHYQLNSIIINPTIIETTVGKTVGHINYHKDHRRSN